MNKDQQFDLQERLIQYAARIIKLAGALPKTDAGRHVAGQILRSGTSPAANYGEAQSAESRADFILKVKISLKELRETNVWLKIIIAAKMIDAVEKLEPLVLETDELTAVLFTSVQTARKNHEKKDT